MAERRTVDGSLALADKQVRVITIEATEKPRATRLRVAAYALVSSSSADQLGSFAAKNDYYQTLIRSKETGRLPGSLPTRASPTPPPESALSFCG